MKMFKWQQTNKHVLSIYLKQNNSREQATFTNVGGNFLIFEQLQSNFWVYCDATLPEFTSIIYSCLLAESTLNDCQLLTENIENSQKNIYVNKVVFLIKC